MKKIKDFRYYGKQRVKVQRILRSLEKENYDSFGLCICFILIALCINLERIFNVDLSIVGGAISCVLIGLFVWYFGCFVTMIICTKLDKFYLSKRVELFKQYLEQKKLEVRTRNKG